MSRRDLRGRSASRRRTLWFGWSAAVLLAQGCGGRSPDQLKKPFFLGDHETGLCGNLVAVDADRVRWLEGGCENGAIVLHANGNFTEPQLEEIRSAFAALPAPGTPCLLEQPAQRDSFQFRIGSATGDSDWTACWDLTGLEAPYQRLKVLLFGP